ncbi:hypothetical protein N2152v2_007574 [Parachlorella kessleri]
MGQKTLDTFLAKRRRVSGPEQTTTQVAAAQEQQQPEQSKPPEPPADSLEQAPRAAGNPPVSPADHPEAGAATAASADGVGTETSSVPVAQRATQFQMLRAHANRNAALAKQVVIGCERSGTLPALRDLVIEDSWRQLLASEFDKPYFADLERFVQGEWHGKAMVFPPKDAIFRAFNSCPVDQVKVVILGQDPYHALGQAMGLSFSVPQGVVSGGQDAAQRSAIPSSLRNMYKELKEDLGCNIPRHGNLEKWAQQGVLLLNAVLTVRAQQAGSHAKKGWEQFTEAAIAKLSQQRSGLVFLLWGRFAQDKERVICPNKHHVLKCAHPSGLSASRGFFGCRHFSQANQLLQQEGQPPIDWQIDP